MGRLEQRITKLEQMDRGGTVPRFVVIRFDSLIMTAAQAIEKAKQEGRVPEGAMVYFFPERTLDRGKWSERFSREWAEKTNEAEVGGHGE